MASVREIWLNCDHKKGKKKKKKRGAEAEQGARGKGGAGDKEAGEQQGGCEWEEKESRYRHVAALLEGCDEEEVLLQVTRFDASKIPHKKNISTMTHPQ